MSHTAPTAMEQFFQLLIQSNGAGPVPLPDGASAYPRHPILNLIGGTVTEDVPNNRLDYTPPSGGGAAPAPLPLVIPLVHVSQSPFLSFTGPSAGTLVAYVNAFVPPFPLPPTIGALSLTLRLAIVAMVTGGPASVFVLSSSAGGGAVTGSQINLTDGAAWQALVSAPFSLGTGPNQFPGDGTIVFGLAQLLVQIPPASPQATALLQSANLVATYA